MTLMTGALSRAAGSPSRLLDRALRDGARQALPVSVALIPAGVALGAFVSTSGFDAPTGWLGGALVYGASPHAAAISLLAGGASAAAVLVAVVALGARGVIYSAGLVSRMRGQPAWFRWAGPYLLVDPLFAIVTGATTDDTPARVIRGYYLGAGLTIWGVWMAAIASGAILGPLIPANAGLAFAITALQIAFLVPGIRSIEAGGAAIAGGMFGAAASGAPGSAGIFLGTIAGTAVGMLLERDER